MSEYKTLLNELRKRHHQTETLLAYLFTEQINFIRDESKRKVAVCGRRAGKTTATAVYCLLEAQKQARSTVVYIALTKGHARRLLWPILRQLNESLKLGIVFNETRLTATLSNGSMIWLTGADSPTEIEKLRGDAYRLAIIDEAGSFGESLNYLINDVLDPALEDHHGTIALVGSPAVVCAGEFYEAANLEEKNYSQHSWNVLQNEKFPRWRGARNWKHQATRWLENKKADRGWDDENPILLREWLGQWTRDTSSLVYKYEKEKNDYDDLPSGIPWRYCIGIDLGFDDATAISVIAGTHKHDTLYLVEEQRLTSCTITDVMRTLDTVIERYNPFSVVADTGGLGKMIVAEINIRHQGRLVAAEKTRKREFIELLNDDLRCSRIKMKKSSHFVREASVLQWDDSGEKEDSRYENHNCDSLLYSWREFRHSTRAQAFVQKSREEREVDSMLQKRIEAVTRQTSDDYI